MNHRRIPETLSSESCDFGFDSAVAPSRAGMIVWIRSHRSSLIRIMAHIIHCHDWLGDVRQLDGDYWRRLTLAWWAHTLPRELPRRADETLLSRGMIGW